MTSCKNTLALAALLLTGTAFAQTTIQNMNIVVVENSNLTVQNPSQTTVAFMQDANDSLDFYDFGNNIIASASAGLVQPFTLTADSQMICQFDARPYIDSYKSIPLGFTTSQPASIKVVLSWRSDPATDSTQRPAYVWIKETASGSMYSVSATDTVSLSIPANSNGTADYTICFGPAIDKQATNTNCFNSADGSISVTNPNNSNWDVDFYSGSTFVSSTHMNTPNYTFNSLTAGSYTVVTKVEGMVVDSSVVTVGSPAAISPSFTISNGPFIAGDTVVFTNNTTGSLTYNWDFGDSNTDNNFSTSHAYAGTGSYIVTLTVTNANGCQESATGNVSISGSLMRPNMTPAHGFETGSDAGADGSESVSDAAAARIGQNTNVTIGTGEQKIVVNQDSDAPVNVEILTIDGRLISSTQTAEASSQFSVPSNGIYIVRITQGAAILECKKIFVVN